MNKKEKELAAKIMAGYLNDARIAEQRNDEFNRALALNKYNSYHRNLRDMLTTRFELFGLDYKKSVQRPLEDVFTLAAEYYSDFCNGVYH